MSFCRANPRAGLQPLWISDRNSRLLHLKLRLARMSVILRLSLRVESRNRAVLEVVKINSKSQIVTPGQKSLALGAYIRSMPCAQLHFTGSVRGSEDHQRQTIGFVRLVIQASTVSWQDFCSIIISVTAQRRIPARQVFDHLEDWLKYC